MSIAVISSSANSVVPPSVPEFIAAAAASIATAVADIGVAKSALELGGSDPLDIGDLLVAVPKANNTTPTWVSKAGDPAWTLFAQNNTTAASAVLFRIVDGSEPATLTFTRSNATSGAELDIWRFRVGTFDTVAPLDVASFVAVSGNPVIPSVTPTEQVLLCQSVSRMVALAGQSWTPPGDGSGTAGNPTERYDVLAATNNLQAAGGTETVPAGATGTRSWTQSGTGAVRAAMFAVKPV